MLASAPMWDLCRFRVFAFALFQCGVFAAAPAADALLDARESGRAAHVEGEGHDRCAPGHNHINPERNHFHCQFTRALYLGVAHSHILPQLRPVAHREAIHTGGDHVCQWPCPRGRAGPEGSSDCLISPDNRTSSFARTRPGATSAMPGPGSGSSRTASATSPAIDGPEAGIRYDATRHTHRSARGHRLGRWRHGFVRPARTRGRD